MKKFLSRFQFNPEHNLKVGVERECFLLGDGSVISPLSPQVLGLLPDSGRFGYELSACQLEERVGPCLPSQLVTEFGRNDDQIRKAENELNFRRLYTEVAPDDMPLDVYPDPTGRYQQITAGMPREILKAACRVAATHVHVGMPDDGVALHVYNRVIKYVDDLVKIGDGSNGERMAIYRQMAPDYCPIPYKDWAAFHAVAQERGFADDPRKCWHLIRISVHGTIEFRMFGSTPDLTKITHWALTCADLCEEAMVR